MRRPPEQVIAEAIRWDHRSRENAARIIESLKAEGYEIRFVGTGPRTANFGALPARITVEP